MLRHGLAPMNPTFLPVLVIPAPERIHAKGNRRAEAVHIPCDRPAPEGPNLATGEPNQMGPQQRYPSSAKTSPRRRRVPARPLPPHKAKRMRVGCWIKYKEQK
jgi:hypothetical protein